MLCNSGKIFTDFFEKTEIFYKSECFANKNKVVFKVVKVADKVAGFYAKVPGMRLSWRFSWSIYTPRNFFTLK